MTSDAPRIVVFGGGIFGITVAVTLAEAGCDVVVVEKREDILRQASLVNQNRLHLGYHYPRSLETAEECLRGLQTFTELYGDSVVTDFSKFYAVAKSGSLTTAAQFEEFCAAASLPAVQKWPTQEFLDRNAVEQCWEVPERIFDYQRLRHLAVEKLRSCASLQVLRNASAVDVAGGPPHKVTFADGSSTEADVIVNATYAGLGEIARLIGCPSVLYQYELCCMPIVELEDSVDPRVGITVMDGPFCSLMPKGVEAGRYIAYHVERSVLQRALDFEEPAWEPVTGLVEHEIIDACREWFPVIGRMTYRDSWITTRVVVPYREGDDARPTLVTNYGSSVYSVFSGKLITCVQAARDLRAELGLAEPPMEPRLGLDSRALP